MSERKHILRKTYGLKQIGAGRTARNQCEPHATRNIHIHSGRRQNACDTDSFDEEFAFAFMESVKI